MRTQDSRKQRQKHRPKLLDYGDHGSVKGKYERNVLIINEVLYNKAGPKARKLWAPLTSTATGDGDVSRAPRDRMDSIAEGVSPAMRRRELRAHKIYLNKERLRLQRQDTRPRARVISTQTDRELTMAERAAVARQTGATPGIPICEATDEELARFCVQHKIQFYVPPGIYDQASVYPKGWIVQSLMMSGGAKKGKKSNRIVGLDTQYIKYTGEASDLRAVDDPTGTTKKMRQYFHISRHPSTQGLELTVREMLLRDRPQCVTLHDLACDSNIITGDNVAAASEGGILRDDTRTPAATSESKGTPHEGGPSSTMAAISESNDGLLDEPNFNDKTFDDDVDDSFDDDSIRPISESSEEEPHDGLDLVLEDGKKASDFLGMRVTKEFKSKGGKKSRGTFHGTVKRIEHKEHLKDPIRFLCLFDEDKKYVSFTYKELKKIVDEDAPEYDVFSDAFDPSSACENKEAVSTTSDVNAASTAQEGARLPVPESTREMGTQTEGLQPEIQRYATESTRWGETTEIKYNDDAELEHARFGHPAAHKLRTLQRVREENIEKDLGIRWLSNKEIEGDVSAKCPCCLENKGRVRRKIKSRNRRKKATRFLQRVHVDESGQLQVMSYGGARYYTVFVDEFTGYKWIYVHERKTDCFDVLQRFLIDAEDDDHKVSIFRFDQSSEHMSHDYADFLRSRSIKVEVPCTESHYQNGIAEKAVRDIAETSRCMMNNPGHRMPRDMWGVGSEVRCVCTEQIATLLTSRREEEESRFAFL